jgi:hypothetical protein
MSIRARKSDYCEDWHIEQEFVCINGLIAWFVIATAEGADEESMGHTDGNFGSAEDRASRIVAALAALDEIETLREEVVHFRAATLAAATRR